MSNGRNRKDSPLSWDDLVDRGYEEAHGELLKGFDAVLWAQLHYMTFAEIQALLEGARRGGLQLPPGFADGDWTWPRLRKLDGDPLEADARKGIIPLVHARVMEEARSWSLDGLTDALHVVATCIPFPKSAGSGAARRAVGAR